VIFQLLSVVYLSQLPLSFVVGCYFKGITDWWTLAPQWGETTAQPTPPS